MNCIFCQKQISGTAVHIRDECPGCGGDLHICLHCEFYDANAYQQCRETVREPVRDKEKANYCDFFRVAKSGTSLNNAGNDAARKLRDLFK